VRQGGLRDAILHSAGANTAHGLRHPNADKRRAVLMLRQDDEWAAWSDREIARRCAVSTDTVGRYRKEQGPSVEIGQIDQPRTDRPAPNRARAGSATAARCAACPVSRGRCRQRRDAGLAP